MTRPAPGGPSPRPGETPAPHGIADDVLARAAAIIDRLSAEYPAHLSRDLEGLERAAASILGDPASRDSHCGDISRIAHDIRGQGATFGYPLLSRLATSLCLAMRSLEPQDRAIETIVVSHVAGMRALLSCRVTGESDRSALTIATGLELLVRCHTGP